MLPYVLIGIALSTLGTAAGLWAHYHPPTHWLTHGYNHLYGLVGPFGVIGVALLVLRQCAAARRARLRSGATTVGAPMSVSPEGPVLEPTGPAHPVNGLDDVVHQRVRLGILTIAHEARRVDFGHLRTQLELTAGNLSQHLGVLEAAGLHPAGRGSFDPGELRPGGRRLGSEWPLAGSDADQGPLDGISLGQSDSDDGM